VAALIRRLASVALLSACAQATEHAATPARALLYPVGATVIMSDGALCVGHRPGRAQDWTGQLSGCPWQMAYQVTNSHPARVRLELQPGPVGTGAGIVVGATSFTAP